MDHVSFHMLQSIASYLFQVANEIASDGIDVNKGPLGSERRSLVFLKYLSRDIIDCHIKASTACVYLVVVSIII